MTNLTTNGEFGKPDERITVEAALAKLHTNFAIAKVCGVHRSTVGRWRKWIPKRHHEQIRAALAK
jgi:DNA invertase Pin-like site-specific DNA recombinase